MLAIDSNVLVYAHRRQSPPYFAARQLLAELAEGDESWAIL